ncbi:MAG: hypothetical protein J5563_06835 [Clostridia bacterium]|nr:hypothetical protein [Clostridia bacterium]
MNISARILVAALALVCILVSLFACAGKNDTPKSTGGLSGATESNVETAPPVIDLDGESFLICGELDMLETFFFEEEQSDELVSDAKYRMISNVEEKYDVDIDIYDSGVVAYDHVGMIKSMIDAGETTYSLVEMHDVLGTDCAVNGYFHNLKNVPYLETERPWWHNAEDMTINGNLYMISTDMTYIDISNTWAIFFNKQLMTDYQIEYPYETVRSGEWTLDRLIAMTKDVYSDLNQNNEVDKGDIYGYCGGLTMYAWMEALGCPMTVIDSDGMLAVTDQISKVSDIASKMYEWLHNSIGAKTSGASDYFDYEGFMDGQYMMFQGPIKFAANQLRALDGFEYGVLPMPKYEEKQPSYITTSMSYPFWIPSSVGEEQTRVTGLMVEALSCEGYNTLIPAYYEKALKDKYSPGDTDSEMIEIIHGSRRPDIVRYYNLSGGIQGMYHILYDVYTSGNTDIMSYFDSKLASTTELLNIYNRAYGF